MSKTTNKTGPSQPTRQPGKSGANPSPRPGPVPAEMDEKGGKTKISTLSLRQQSALPLVALSPSISQAARSSGVGETTLRRWLDDPAFHSEVVHLRQESADLARQELQGLMLRGVSVISDAMDDPNPAIRLRAARYALSFAVKASEMQRLAADLKELKNSLASRRRIESSK